MYGIGVCMTCDNKTLYEQCSECMGKRDLVWRSDKPDRELILELCAKVRSLEERVMELEEELKGDYES